MKPFILAVVAAIQLTSVLSAEAEPEFAVASVKPGATGITGKEGGDAEKITISPNGVTMVNVSLRSSIQWAYGAGENQITGPGWLASQRFNITANAAGPATPADLKLMMQALLATRFHLKLRRDAKELPIYAMLTGKKGSKLQPASGEGTPEMKVSGGSIVFKNYSMPQLAERMAARPFRLDRLVVDKTGLDGAYDFAITLSDNVYGLKKTFESMERGATDSPSWFTILPEQLGLTLKADKGPVETLIIESIDKVPTEN